MTMHDIGKYLRSFEMKSPIIATRRSLRSPSGPDRNKIGVALGTYPRVDDPFNDRLVCPLRKVDVSEPGLHRECDIIQPIKEFVLLSAEQAQ